jgi:hypothetical protein
MKRPLWIIAVGALIVVVVAGAVWTMGLLAPYSIDRPPKLDEVSPLPPITRSSLIVSPVVIPLRVIQDAVEQGVPRNLSNQNASNSPSLPNMPNLGLNWSLVREPFAIGGDSGGVTLSSALQGSIHATAAMSGPQGSPGSVPGGFPGGPPGGGFPGVPPRGFPFGPPPGFHGPPGFPGSFGGPGETQQKATPQRNTDQQKQSDNAADQSVEFNGQITLTTRPVLLPEWRLEPNLAAQAVIGEARLTLMGTTISLSDQMKPVVERIISQQVAAVQAQTANSPRLEQGVREQWAKLCHTIPLGSGPPGMPDLWLELRPTRALAAQPLIDHTAVTLTIGVRAETRVVTAETKPVCPFPAQLDIVSQIDQGQVNVDLPIDIPFSEVNRLVEAQLKGKSFPISESGGITATVRGAKLQASGDRLVMSLGIRVNETKTWLRLGADATIHIWGKPVLDRARQRLHFDYIELDVQSEAVFGALGFAAQPAVPYLQKTLADHAEVDLAPLVANARKNIEAAIVSFRNNTTDAQLEAQVVGVQLAGIEFDATTLRIIASAEGTVRVTVNSLIGR